MQTDNEKRRKEIVKGLIGNDIVPDSVRWQRVEALTGYDGDYTPADVGQPIEEKE